MAQSAPAALPILELDVMKTFIAIAETGNFTTAAEAVFRTPSAVSMQIKKLEETLGVPLFRRDARSVSLTHHGEMLLSFAKRLIALNNEAVSRFVVPEMNGIVKLGAPDDIGELVLPGILSHLSETWPQLAIDVTIESSANLHRAVEDGRLDLAIYNFLYAVRADPAAWGDVVLARKEVPASYHLSVTVDDALQGVTHVVRGRDLFHATAVHRVLQELLGLPAPLYHHHDLVLGDDGSKLSKSRNDTALGALRESGMTPADIRRMIGL